MAKPLRFPRKMGPSEWAGHLGHSPPSPDEGSSSGFWKALLPGTPLLKAILGREEPFPTTLRIRIHPQGLGTHFLNGIKSCSGNELPLCDKACTENEWDSDSVAELA